MNRISSSALLAGETLTFVASGALLNYFGTIPEESLEFGSLTFALTVPFYLGALGLLLFSAVSIGVSESAHQFAIRTFLAFARFSFWVCVLEAPLYLFGDAHWAVLGWNWSVFLGLALILRPLHPDVRTDNIMPRKELLL